MTQFPPSQPPRRRRLVTNDSGADQPPTAAGSQGGAGTPARRNSGSSRVNPKSTRSGSGAPAQPISTRSTSDEATRTAAPAQARPSSRVGRSGAAVPLPDDAAPARPAAQTARPATQAAPAPGHASGAQTALPQSLSGQSAARTSGPQTIPPQSIPPRTGSAQARPSSRVGRSGGAVPLSDDVAPARPAAPAAVGRGGAPTRTGLRPTAQPATVPPRRNSRASSRPVMPTRLPIDEPPSSPSRGKRRWLKYTSAVLAVILITLCGYTWHLWNKASDQLRRIDALSSMADTPGETWLIVGSDSRADGAIADTTTAGQRADSVMVLHKAENGQTSLTSLPRDTYVNIPGYGEDKINASYAYGGAKLLVKTVEGLTKMKINHYVEVGMGGVKNVVDAVGGVEACLDYDVDDHDSGLIWNTAQGKCQQVNGEKALAFSRMRKSDPTGDIGRGLRQRAIISAAVKKAMSPSTLLNPSATSKLVDAGTGSLTVDKDSGVWDIGQMVLAFRSASNDGLTGAPPIEDPDYEPGDVGSTVLLVDTTAPIFFGKVRDGRLTASDFNQAK
ncbi:MAG: LCP family protein [Actinomyces graevenitzii]|uniref:LCP family protein n=1 Tax=Actinomyces graevenitzii TaxID=55565 RepID=A0A9E7ARB4_9ACTO|nr:MAG: LCP family protein [Actinomyces graevenitzii]